MHKIITLVLGIIISMGAAGGQAGSYSPSTIKQYSEVLGQYVAAITSLDLISKGRCSYALIDKPFSYDKSLQEGLDFYPKELHGALSEAVEELQKIDFRQMATNANKLAYEQMVKTTDEKTACGFVVGMAARNYVFAITQLQQIAVLRSEQKPNYFDQFDE